MATRLAAAPTARRRPNRTSVVTGSARLDSLRVTICAESGKPALVALLGSRTTQSADIFHTALLLLPDARIGSPSAS